MDFYNQIPNMFAFVLYIATFLPLGLSLQIAEQDSTVLDNVFKELPHAQCDMIVVSSAPFQGEI